LASRTVRNKYLLFLAIQVVVIGYSSTRKLRQRVKRTTINLITTSNWEKQLHYLNPSVWFCIQSHVLNLQDRFINQCYRELPPAPGDYPRSYHNLILGEPYLEPQRFSFSPVYCSLAFSKSEVASFWPSWLHTLISSSQASWLGCSCQPSAVGLCACCLNYRTKWDTADIFICCINIIT
jgi:hypothetical protein